MKLSNKTRSLRQGSMAFIATSQYNNGEELTTLGRRMYNLQSHSSPSHHSSYSAVAQKHYHSVNASPSAIPGIPEHYSIDALMGESHPAAGLDWLEPAVDEIRLEEEGPLPRALWEISS